MKIQQKASNHWSDIDFRDFMKLCKNYAKEPYPFLYATLPSYNPLQFRKNLLWNDYCWENKTIDKKIKQYDLDRQIVNMKKTC